MDLTDGTNTHTWNARDQLSALSGGATASYDNAGRRTQVAGSYARTNLPSAVASATYNANNQLTNWGGATLTYDNNGNLLTDGTNTHTWNARDQLASISGGATASFGYDAFNRRRTKTVAGTKTDFLYDGLNFVQEKDGVTIKANLLTGLGVDEVFRRTQGAVTSDVLPDALGSSVALSDSTKAITTQYTYAPYGTTTQTGPANDNAQRFTGREDDGATGLYYYRARYYSPKYSRFVAEDPIDFAGGANIYAYVTGNPVSYTDPAGEGNLPRRPDIDFLQRWFLEKIFGIAQDEAATKGPKDQGASFGQELCVAYPQNPNYDADCLTKCITKYGHYRSVQGDDLLIECHSECQRAFRECVSKPKAPNAWCPIPK